AACNEVAGICVAGGFNRLCRYRRGSITVPECTGGSASEPEMLRRGASGEVPGEVPDTSLRPEMPRGRRCLAEVPDTALRPEMPRGRRGAIGEVPDTSLPRRGARHLVTAGNAPRPERCLGEVPDTSLLTPRYLPKGARHGGAGRGARRRGARHLVTDRSE